MMNSTFKDKSKKQKTPQPESDNYGELGKIPPNAVDFEAAILGALLLEGGNIDGVKILEPECFYKPAHEKIYRAILRLNDKHSAVDMLTVAEELKQSGELEEVGGPHYLSQLTMVVGSAAHVEYHAQIVFEKYVKRELIRLGAETIADGYDESAGVDDTVAGLEQRLNDIIQQIAGHTDAMHISKIANECVEDAFKRMENIHNGKFSGISTGLQELNRFTCGWQPSKLIILAARPAMGKTSLMLHFAKSAAKEGKAALIFSLEMSRHELGNRFLLSEEDITPYHFRSGYMNSAEGNILERSLGKIENLPIYIEDNSDVSMNKIRARARAMQKKGKCDIVFIDYLQLCREKGTGGRTRNDEVSAMSREAKIIAKELNIPVILLSQLSRKVEERKDGHKPLLSDLRDSGSIEQDADIVVFIHRPERYGIQLQDEKGNDLKNSGELIVAKNRDGACGTVTFTHNVAMTKISDYEAGF
jgi:replicative DNA helicase